MWQQSDPPKLLMLMDAWCRVQPFHYAAHFLGLAATALLTLVFLLPMQPVNYALPWHDLSTVFFQIPNMARAADLPFGLFLTTTLATIAVTVSRRYFLFLLVTAHHLLALILIAKWQTRLPYSEEGFRFEHLYVPPAVGENGFLTRPLALWLILLIAPILLLAGLLPWRIHRARDKATEPRQLILVPLSASGPCGVWLLALGVFMAGFMPPLTLHWAMGFPAQFTVTHYAMLGLAIGGFVALRQPLRFLLLPWGLAALALVAFAWYDLSLLGAVTWSRISPFTGRLESPLRYTVGWCILSAGGLLMLCGGATALVQRYSTPGGYIELLSQRSKPYGRTGWIAMFLLLPIVNAMVFYIFLRRGSVTSFHSLRPDFSDPYLMWTRLYLLPGLTVAWWLQYWWDPRLHLPATCYTAGSWIALYLSFWVMNW